MISQFLENEKWNAFSRVLSEWNNKEGVNPFSVDKHFDDEIDELEEFDISNYENEVYEDYEIEDDEQNTIYYV